MKKIYFVVFVLPALFICGGIIYINNYVMPARVKPALVEEIERMTGKRLTLGSVRLGVLNSFVLRDIAVYDDGKAILKSKEVTCRFLVLPLLKKKVIVSSLTFNAPEVFIERRADGSVNIAELLPREFAGSGQVIIRKIRIRNGAAVLRDDALTAPFIKTLNNLNASLYFSVPAEIKYEISFGFRNDPGFMMRLSGVYRITGEIDANINIKALAPKDVSPYYERPGFSVLNGRIDCSARLAGRKDTLAVDAKLRTSGMEFIKDDIGAVADSDIEARWLYYFSEKRLAYSGKAHIARLDISGLDDIGQAEDVRGEFVFDNESISSEDMTAKILGVPVKGKLRISNFNSPIVDLDLNATVSLAKLQAELADIYGISLPLDMEGAGDIRLKLRSGEPDPDSQTVEGALNTAAATFKLGGGRAILKNVSGRFDFTQDRLEWAGASFTYKDTAYTSSGSLAGFDVPVVQLNLYSKDIAVESMFTMKDTLLRFSDLEIKHGDSVVLLKGDVDVADPKDFFVNLNGLATVELRDLAWPLRKFKDRWDKMKPSGRMRAEFSIGGKLSDLKQCVIEARLEAESLSLYGFKSSRAFINYRQKNGIAKIPFSSVFLYDGVMNATAGADLLSRALPYNVDVEIKDVKLEKLKEDTAFRDNDIGGSVKAAGRMFGYIDDISSLTGSGTIAISKGRLWQLNLFKGLGVLLFTSDFSDILFDEGFCSFHIKDKVVNTDDLILQSELINMRGPVTIDFQKVVSASLKAEVADRAYWEGARKNLTDTIGRYSTIEIAGTLKDPKYRIKPDVGSIIETIRESVFPSQ